MNLLFNYGNFKLYSNYIAKKYIKTFLIEVNYVKIGKLISKGLKICKC